MILKDSLYQAERRHKTPPEAPSNALPEGSENGFALYLILGFIALVTFNLAAMGHRMNQQNQMQFRALQAEKRFLHAHAGLQIGLLALRDDIDLLTANLTGYRLPTGSMDNTMLADREACLQNRNGYDSTTASEFIASSPASINGNRMRYFMRDTSRNSLARSFDIFGCFVHKTQGVRVTQGGWQFDRNRRDFALLYIQRFR